VDGDPVAIVLLLEDDAGTGAAEHEETDSA
jgi:hypothetical protein